MATVGQIYDALNSFAPVRFAQSTDNVGLLAGRRSAQVDSVLVALDITQAVIEEACRLRAQLIVSHHPLFFSLGNASDEAPEGANLIKLLENGIAAICMHTNLDASPGGVNDELACAVGLKDTLIFGKEPGQASETGYGLGRIGELKKQEDIRPFAVRVKAALGASGARYFDAGRPVKRVAVSSGSGSSMFFPAAALGCDTFVAGELKYSTYLQAEQLKINLVEAGHFYTENLICPVIADVIRKAYPDIRIEISKRHKDGAVYI